jgi:Na+/H+ antiporter NhaD/arsenite permease-like protein
MVIVGSFFVIAGGIHLRVKSPSGAMRNTLFLFVGALLGNLIGTIGASMLLIRPWIAMNKGRVAPMHIAFFIFLVSNIGGALLPVGPPLFLGYLKGVPFWWTLQRCWLPWSVTLAAVLIIFCVLDSLHSRKRHPSDESASESAPGGNWHCDGGTHFIFMLVILAALIAAPAGWREAIMVSTAVTAYLFTPRRIHRVLILGAGGAARAVAYALHHAGALVQISARRDAAVLARRLAR